MVRRCPHLGILRPSVCWMGLALFMGDSGGVFLGMREAVVGRVLLPSPSPSVAAWVDSSTPLSASPSGGERAGEQGSGITDGWVSREDRDNC